MGLIDLLVRDVTVITPGAFVNGYGDTQYDWVNSNTDTVAGWIAQQSTTRDLDGRTAVITSEVLVVAPDVTITAPCRVQVDGRTWEVDGDPIAAWTPRGVHHLEVPLRGVDG